VSRHEIARLYRADARGVRDEGLLDEVGYGLLVRIEDILTVTEAHRGRVKCPNCGEVILRSKPKLRKDAEKEMLECGGCEWRLPWMEYFRSYHKKRLLAGGLEPFLREFAREYPRAKGYGGKIVLVDTLLHRYHWELEGNPGGPGAANLIGGTRNEVIAFLNELAYGRDSTSGLEENRTQWRKKLGWANWSESNVDERSKEHRWESWGEPRTNGENTAPGGASCR